MASGIPNHFTAGFMRLPAATYASQVQQVFSEVAAFAWSLCSQSSCDRLAKPGVRYVLGGGFEYSLFSSLPGEMI